jgi:protein TonB
LVQPRPAAPQQPERTEERDERAAEDLGEVASGEEGSADAGASTAGEGVGVASGGDGGTGAPAPLSAEQQRLIDSYARRIYRDRIARFVKYPLAAQEAGIEGTVLLLVSISAAGALVDVRVVSTGAHAWLCDSATRAIRDAAPFPALPAGLGAIVAFELPFDFRLE